MAVKEDNAVDQPVGVVHLLDRLRPLLPRGQQRLLALERPDRLNHACGLVGRDDALGALTELLLQLLPRHRLEGMADRHVGLAVQRAPVGRLHGYFGPHVLEPERLQLRVDLDEHALAHAPDRGVAHRFGHDGDRSS